MRVLAILFGIDKQKLTERKKISVLDFILLRPSLALPVRRRLADAIIEPKWLGTVQIRRWQVIQQFECSIPSGALDGLCPPIEPARLRVDHHQQMRNLPRPTPAPELRRIGAHISESSRPAFLPRHAGE